MIPTILAAQAGFGLARAGFGLATGFGAARQRRAAGLEELRRLRLAHERTISETRAVAAASGAEFESSSTQTYLTAMADEFRRQEDWLRKAADAEAGSMQMTSLFNAFSDFGGSMFSFGAMNNWFQQPTAR